MSAFRPGRTLLAGLCAGALALSAAAPAAQGAADPIFVYTPNGATTSLPPAGRLEGPCGIAVDAFAGVYVSDYYHHVVDVLSAGPSSLSYTGAQAKEVGPLDGPCGLAVDSAGKVYVNDYHRDAVRYTPSSFPPLGTTTFGAPLTIDSENPTGVAVGTGNRVFVDDRAFVAVYEPSGAPVLDGDGQPLRIGALGDGYGLAVNGNTLYVADAASQTIEVYDSTTGALLQTIAGPPGGFASLRDSALAVDRVSGDLYVSERRGSSFAERPEATIDVFDSSGTYKGHLKYNVVDAAPVGLAVDNSFAATQGRVYVTSGNTSRASIYAYAPGSATTAPLASPASVPVSGTPAALFAAPHTTTGAAGADPVAKASEITQRGTLRLALDGAISPRRLPRKGAAPIAVSVGWRVATTDGTAPPQLSTISLQINRAGRFDLEGLPTCPYPKIQPASTARALANCRPALVGRGTFTALVRLAGSEAETYEAKGTLLLFNGARGKQPVLFGQIYAAHPFATSFVIPFELKSVPHGTFGTELRAKLPASLNSWGTLTGIEMRLQRRFGYQGRSHSFLSAGCPAPAGFPGGVFPLARGHFTFAEGPGLTLRLNGNCKTRG